MGLDQLTLALVCPVEVNSKLVITRGAVLDVVTLPVVAAEYALSVFLTTKTATWYKVFWFKPLIKTVLVSPLYIHLAATSFWKYELANVKSVLAE